MAGIILFPIWIALVYWDRRAYFLLIVYLGLWTYWIGSGIASGIETSKQRAMVHFDEVRYAPKRCGDRTPMLVQVHNGSDWPVSKVSYSIEGVTPGYTVINYASDYEDNWIIAPHTTWNQCAKLPRQQSFDNAASPDQTKWFMTVDNFWFVKGK